jgi:hypothetical protein
MLLIQLPVVVVVISIVVSCKLFIVCCILCGLSCGSKGVDIDGRKGKRKSQERSRSSFLNTKISILTNCV